MFKFSYKNWERTFLLHQSPIVLFSNVAGHKSLIDNPSTRCDFSLYDCHLDVCDSQTRMQKTFSICSSDREQELCHVETITYASLTNVRENRIA